MSATEPTATLPVTSPPAKAGTAALWRGLAWLLVLAVAAALAFGGWQVWQRLESTTETLESADSLIRRLSQQLRVLESEQLRQTRHLADSDTALTRQGAQLDALAAQHQAALAAIAELDATLEGGRTRFQLAAVEELLVLAQSRVLLGGDAATAVVALEQADARLAGLNDARLLPVRQALSNERLALLAAPRADLTGAALAIGGLIDRSPGLPLRGRVPSRADQVAVVPMGDGAVVSEGGEWPSRLLAGAKSALTAVFRIQRESRPVDRLLPPEQEVLVRTLFDLKLEGARLALLRQEPESYRDLIDGALRHLALYFTEGDARVLATKAELERLRAQPLKPALPVPVKALEQLRGLSLVAAR